MYWLFNSLKLIKSDGDFILFGSFIIFSLIIILSDGFDAILILFLTFPIDVLKLFSF